MIPPYLPVPAVKGGAVETLSEDIIRLNEKYKDLEIDCVTKKDKTAAKLYSKYNRTKFICFNAFDNKILIFIFRGIRFFCKKVLKTNYDLQRNMIAKEYKKILTSSDYDFIVSEGVNYCLTENTLESIEKEKLILHMHKHTKPTKEFEKMYGNFIGISKFVSLEFNTENIIEKNRIYTVYNGIDLKRFDKRISDVERKKLRAKYGLKDTDVVCCYAGRLLPEKGVKELIQAFLKIDNMPDCKLLIVGSAVSSLNKENQYTLELKKMSEEKGVVFTGYISNKEMYKYYQISDFAVFPSTCEEGFGLVCVEAMRSRLPLLVTNSGGMPEVVTDEFAFKVDLDEQMVENLYLKLIELFKNKALRKKMGDKAWEISSKFSSENYYKNFVETLKKIKEKRKI